MNVSMFDGLGTGIKIFFYGVFGLLALLAIGAITIAAWSAEEKIKQVTIGRPSGDDVKALRERIKRLEKKLEQDQGGR